MTDLVFLDTETTGLDPELHDVWEIAWAVNDGPIQSCIVTHSIQTADPKSLEMNGYWSRGFPMDAVQSADVTLREILTGATIVGANPAFDTAFLRARWGVSPWHHRLIDVESMGLAVLRYKRPKGLQGLATDLRDLGYEIPEPDHTAAADVATTRAVYDALRALARGLGENS